MVANLASQRGHTATVNSAPPLALMEGHSVSSDPQLTPARENEGHMFVGARRFEMTFSSYTGQNPSLVCFCSPSAGKYLLSTQHNEHRFAARGVCGGGGGRSERSAGKNSGSPKLSTASPTLLLAVQLGGSPPAGREYSVVTGSNGA